MLALLQFTIVLDFMILSPLGDIMMKSLDMNPGQFGSVVSAYAISAGISGFLAAGFADKHDRKKLLLFFYTGFIAGTLYCAMANTFHHLFVARILAGLFGGVMGSIAMAIVTDLFPLEQRGRVMGYIQMAFAGSQILGIPAGLYIATHFNWHATFFMVAALGIVVGLAVVFGMKPVAAHLLLQSEIGPLRHLCRTLAKKDYQTGFMATSMLSMGAFMLMPFTSAFLVNNVLIPQDRLAIIFLATGISSIVIMPIMGRISDRVDKFKLFAIGSVWAAIMTVVQTNLRPVPIWVVILVNMLLFMGIMSRMVPSMALSSALPGPSDRGAYMSINSSLQQMAGGVAAIFAGMVVVQPAKSAPLQHYNVLGFAMVGIILTSIFLVRRVDRIVKEKGLMARTQ